MIIVIADDLTGAAEVSGIAMRYGLSAEVQTRLDPEIDSDVLALDTNTRSKTQTEASQVLDSIVEQIKLLPIDLVFKKIDSVLRGHILAEIESLLTGLSKKRALLVPANPGRGRIIRNGKYYIDDQPINYTEFANDPEFPVSTANVVQILQRQTSEEVTVLSQYYSPPESGIIVGEASNTQDLSIWAKHVNDHTLPAGAAEFFQAVLTQKGYEPRKMSDIKVDFEGKKILGVLGSASDSSRRSADLLRNQDVALVLVPIPCSLNELRENRTACIALWKNSILNRFEKEQTVWMVIDQPIEQNTSISRELRSLVAGTIREVKEAIQIDEMLIEGGATASAIMYELSWSRFIDVQEFSPGVVRMRASCCQGQFITLKPGSYSWPDELIVHG